MFRTCSNPSSRCYNRALLVWCWGRPVSFCPVRLKECCTWSRIPTLFYILIKTVQEFAFTVHPVTSLPLSHLVSINQLKFNFPFLRVSMARSCSFTFFSLAPLLYKSSSCCLLSFFILWLLTSFANTLWVGLSVINKCVSLAVLSTKKSFSACLRKLLDCLCLNATKKARESFLLCPSESP